MSLSIDSLQRLATRFPLISRKEVLAAAIGRTGSFFINTVAKTIRSQTLYLILEHEASAYPV